jgi:hypothetical protein
MVSNNTYTINYSASIQVVIRQLRKHHINPPSGLSTQRTLLYETPSAKLFYCPDLGCQIDVYDSITGYQDANALLQKLKLKPTLELESLLSYYGVLSPFTSESPESLDNTESSH